VAALAVSVASGIAFAALSRQDVAPADSSGSTAACTGDPLYITADPAVVPTLSALADDFAAALQDEGRECVRIETREMAARDVVTALQEGWDTGADGPPPDVWVPDSSAWLSVYRNESDDQTALPEEARVLARSPLVFAMPQPMADEMPDSYMKWRDLLGLADLENGWGEYGHDEWGQPHLAVTDPLRTTEGMLTLLSLGVAQDQVWAGGSTDEARISIDSDLGVLRFRRAVSSVAPEVGAKLRGYLEAADPLREMSGIPLLERQVWQYNRGQMELPPGAEGSEATAQPLPMPEQPEVILKAVYPTEGAFGADYPFVIMAGDWVDDGTVQVAEEFEELLLSEGGQSRFEADGFRDANNSSNEVHRTEDGLIRQAGGFMLEDPDPAVVGNVRRSWRNVAAPSRTLLAVDVSGSMVVEVPGSDQTRLEAVIDAAVESLDVLPSSSDVGLWEFSTDLPGGVNEGDYRELVPLGPLNEEIDEADRKTAVVDALNGLDPEKDTALNDTALAAFLEMQSTYEPGARHTIVLLTDGRNDDEGSISNRKLVEQLTQLRDDEQPVRIVTIAYGEEADIRQMEAIAEATDGAVLASPNAEDLEVLFLAALSGS
jgi:Ca-activated chloride channel family protein